MRENLTKAKLSSGDVVYGALINRYAPDQVEIFGALGYDFVMLDCEHGPMHLDQVVDMVRAGEVFGITPIARIPDHSESTILRYLDRGLQGVIIPHVNDKETAESVAMSARYYPDGNRGMGSGRAHDYGIGTDRDSSTSWINQELLVIPMIEDITAVQNLDEISTVQGADIFHVAASDLGQSMGNPDRAEVRKVMGEVIPKIRAANKWAGIGGNSPTDAEGVAEFINLGANFVTISAWGLLRLGAEDFLTRVNRHL